MVILICIVAIMAGTVVSVLLDCASSAGDMIEFPAPKSGDGV